VEDNIAKEHVQLVDFEEGRGSGRRLQRMNMWRRTLLRSLFSWWILKRGSMIRMMLKRLYRWWILGAGDFMEDFEMEG
jgi:hypothetical protein